MSQGTTTAIATAAGNFIFEYKVTLGEALICVFLLLIVIVLVFRWLGDWYYDMP